MPRSKKTKYYESESEDDEANEMEMHVGGDFMGNQDVQQDNDM